jgi:hypothetical protein
VKTADWAKDVNGPRHNNIIMTFDGCSQTQDCSVLSDLMEKPIKE